MTHADLMPVDEALEQVLGAVEPLGPETVLLQAAAGRILATDVAARDSLPPFDNSSMDGYAVRAADVRGAAAHNPVRLEVVGDIAAGTVPDFRLEPGQAARIMTGAPVPSGADSVVPVELTDEAWRDRTRSLPPNIAIKAGVDVGDHIRPKGDDIRPGQTVLRAGARLQPSAISVLASLGVAQLSVVRIPRVGILATGDELIPVSKPLTPGKIRNSNSYGLAAHVLELGAMPVDLGVARDTESDVRKRLESGLESGVDLFISSAGVSVGAYDVVKAVLDEGGDVGFWRVNMRPGKPLAFGTYGGVPYFGLPGNPVSALLSFEVFARQAILKMAGHTRLTRPRVVVTLRDELGSDGRETYARAVVTRGAEGWEARLAGGQGSHQMQALVEANALVVMPAGVRRAEPGDQLEAMMIEWPNTVVTG